MLSKIEKQISILNRDRIPHYVCKICVDKLIIHIVQNCKIMCARLTKDSHLFTQFMN